MDFLNPQFPLTLDSSCAALSGKKALPYSRPEYGLRAGKSDVLPSGGSDGLPSGGSDRGAVPEP